MLLGQSVCYALCREGLGGNDSGKVFLGILIWDVYIKDIWHWGNLKKELSYYNGLLFICVWLITNWCRLMGQGLTSHFTAQPHKYSAGK